MLNWVISVLYSLLSFICLGAISKKKSLKISKKGGDKQKTSLEDQGKWKWKKRSCFRLVEQTSSSLNSVGRIGTLHSVVCD